MFKFHVLTQKLKSTPGKQRTSVSEQLPEHCNQMLTYVRPQEYVRKSNRTSLHPPNQRDLWDNIVAKGTLFFHALSTSPLKRQVCD